MKSLLVAGLIFACVTEAKSIRQHEPYAQEMFKLKNSPEYRQPREYSTENPNWQPALDTSDFKYVLFSSEWIFDEARNLRYTIAKNLPEGVKLVLLVNNSSVESVKKAYAPYISMDRVILAVAPNINNGFWARDAFPYPVVNTEKALSLVSAKYYRPFNASPSIAQALQLNMSQNNFTFVGGNLLADESGHCFSVDSYRLFNTTERDLRAAYGCKEVTLLKHYSGIGDVDEVLKPLGGGKVLTNTPAYVPDLEKAGYQVIQLPAVPDSYRTYANSLVVGKTVFMPTYEMSTDSEAQKVYEGLGYKVVGIRSNTLSDDYHGSIHCQVMAYPAMSEAALFEMLGLQKIQ